MQIVFQNLLSVMNVCQCIQFIVASLPFVAPVVFSSCNFTCTLSCFSSTDVFHALMNTDVEMSDEGSNRSKTLLKPLGTISKKKVQLHLKIKKDKRKARKKGKFSFKK